LRRLNVRKFHFRFLSDTLNSVESTTTVQTKAATRHAKSAPPSEQAALVLANHRAKYHSECSYRPFAPASREWFDKIPENGDCMDNRENVPPKTAVPRIRNPSPPKDTTTKKPIDDEVDEMLPVSFQKHVQKELA
jgi:hypothetical protein